MKKNRFIILGALAISLSLTLPGCTTIDTVGRENHGAFQNVSIPAKDFQSLGLVFTEASFDTDDKGSRGDVFTYNALLKEAQKLGADTIANVVIDVKKEGANEWLKFLGSKKDLGVVSGKETWYGSATAIKYTDAIKNTDTLSGGASSNGNDDSSGSLAQAKPKKKWWNPLTWFK